MSIFSTIPSNKTAPDNITVIKNNIIRIIITTIIIIIIIKVNKRSTQTYHGIL